MAAVVALPEVLTAPAVKADSEVLSAHLRQGGRVSIYDVRRQAPRGLRVGAASRRRIATWRHRPP